MSNLPKDLLSQLQVVDSKVVQQQTSSDGTIKLLVELSDGARIETVLIPTERFATACLSTQVGCGMGCVFCASGSEGLERNLRSDEILAQLLHLRAAAGRPISHVVFMGMGEPLANYSATLEAVRAIIDPERFGISARRVTVSTVGIPSGIRRLAKEDLPLTLAISLHAPTDALRQRIIPAAERWPLEKIIAAAKEYFASRGREVTLEYVLIAGLNDTNVCADGLSRLASQLRCSVNLIRYNPTPCLPHQPPSRKHVEEFADRLRRAGVNVQVRKSRGKDIAGACGQLRRKHDAPDQQDLDSSQEPDQPTQE